MEFSCRCHSTTGRITSSMLLPFGLWAPAPVGVASYRPHTWSLGAPCTPEIVREFLGVAGVTMV